MPDNNARQADVIPGAAVLPNSRGTAPGQWLETECDGKSRIVVLLPGPPHELEPLWEKQCMPRLRAVVPPAAIGTRVLKTAMLPESAADARTAPIYKKHPEVETTVLSGQGQVEFHLRATGGRKRKPKPRSTGWLENWKTNWATLSFPPPENRWNRSSAITCRCAMPSWPSPNRAPEE